MSIVLTQKTNMQPYEVWLYVFVVVPMLTLWALFYRLLWRYRVAIFWSSGVWLVIGLAWDFLAVYLKIWGWSASCCALPRVYGLPLEEPLFIALMALSTATVTIIIRDIFLAHHWLKRRERRR